MTKTQSYRRQINQLLDQLQAQLESNAHLEKPDVAQGYLATLSLRWHFLSEEDRDYVQCAQTAVEEQLEWNIDS